MTFLFTDIEASTRRWQQAPETMPAALAAHDEVLRTEIDARGGWLFKHTGDGVCAAFASAAAAVDAAIEAQRQLGLPVRMGLVTGEAEPRGDDYLGPVLNRASRVMDAGHGGQILVSGTTAGLLTDIELRDLGPHRLRDLAEPEHLFQARADGLEASFPPLRTADATLGNLPTEPTSLVGRDREVEEVRALVEDHQLVTLTGVGGVGKTRLAVQVATDVADGLPDGAWMVELAPVRDAASVPLAVATALDVRPRPDTSVTASIAEALSERTLLVVLDNCEHVLDAAAELAEAILASSTTVRILATSREGLRARGEHLWAVPTLEVSVGTRSAAVELFVERAQAVVAGFGLDDPVDQQAVTQICRRLDGIALAIELAAARMVSMTPSEVLSHLDHRFRLLAGSPRGVERHHTLGQAVQWSYDLLTGDEQAVLRSSAVFAGRFDAPGVSSVCGAFDDVAVLDLLDSLVRKSLLTVSRTGGRTRYRLLETVREFALQPRLARPAGDTGDDLDGARDRHARHFADEAVAHWEGWDGPGQPDVCDWVELELDDLRAGFRWATDRGDLPVAASIAAHAMALSFTRQLFEPAAWAEELLPAAESADLEHLPRLYMAASFCQYSGRSSDGVRYAEAAAALQDDPRYRPFDAAWVAHRAALTQLFSGRVDRYVEACTALLPQGGLAHVIGLFGLTYGLPLLGRGEEAAGVAEDALAAAWAHGNPFWIASAHLGYGRAYSGIDPARALAALREGLEYTRRHRIRHFEALLAREAAGVEAVHGDLDHAIELFATTLASFHRAGDAANLRSTLASIGVLLHRVGETDAAATVLGRTVEDAYANVDPDVADATAKVREVLGEEAFARRRRAGAAMSPSEVVRSVQETLDRVRAGRPGDDTEAGAR